jgi:hypothetical protein
MITSVIFINKADLFEAIFRSFDERLIRNGFADSPGELFESEGPFDLAGFLIQGARRFFGRADRNVLLIWRILMISQYRHEAARDGVRAHLLDAPCRFFTNIFHALRRAGRIRSDADCDGAGRIIAAVFFDYSFRSNLELAWGDDDADEARFERLGADLAFIAEKLTPEKIPPAETADSGDTPNVTTRM